MRNDFVADLLAASAGRGWRSAALTLHAMAEPDRRWVMARLSPSQCASLEPLLVELAMLAVPPDPQLVSEALQHGSAPAGDPDAKLLQQVAALPAAVVARLLAGEPAGVIQRIVSLRPWPWRDEVLDRLNAQRVELPMPFDPTIEASPVGRLEQRLLQLLLSRAGSAGGGTERRVAPPDSALQGLAVAAIGAAAHWLIERPRAWKRPV